MEVVVDQPDSVTETRALRGRRRRATRPSGPAGHRSSDAEAAEVPPETAPPPAEPPPNRQVRLPIGPRWVRTLAGVLAVTAVAAVCTVAVRAFIEHRHIAAAERQRAAVVDTARRAVTDLINIHHDSADPDLSRLAAITTAPFADDLRNQTQTYARAINDDNVNSSGTVAAAAVATNGDTGDTTVIVAANAEVTNTQTPQREQRIYRFAVTVKQVDGALKVSDLEFVP